MPGATINLFNRNINIQQLHRQLSIVVNVLLVIAIAWLLKEITWQFFPQEVDTPVVNTPVKPVVRSNTQQNFRRLAAAHILGENRAVQAPRPTKAPETKLNLTLKGVLATDPMEMASAIISQGRAGKEEIYGIGDKMKGGVIIKEIHPEYVVLDRRGRLETLKLQKQSGLGNKGFQRSTTSLSPSTRGNTPGQVLKKIRKEILKSPTSFGNYALPVVVKENGKQVGYRLQPQSQGKLLAEMGIQPSDIITQVNGVKLDKPQNGISALRKLSTANQLNLMVKRNGTEVPLNIRLK